MEDAAKALEMAGAMLILVIALTIAFLLMGRAKATSDAVFLATDRTGMVEYVDEDDAPNSKTTRIVGIETIIPTMYRYNDETMRIVIINNRQQIVLVLDTAIEVELPSKRDGKEPEKVGPYPEFKVISEIIGQSILNDRDLYRKYVETYRKSTTPEASKYAPWTNTGYINKRIDMICNNETADINGSKINYTQLDFKSMMNSKFEEKFFTYKLDDKSYSVDGETIDVVASRIKKVVIYVQQ